ncbi:MAG: Wzz/FepE/Etk N-terminal domain-containing protein, partial [candidate division NC10 bacterium]
MEQNEVELIDYLNVVWKRKGLIIGGTLVVAAAALVVSLSMPKLYEVSHTLKIGQYASETREDVMQHLG